MKTAFVTVGTTSFDELAAAATAPEALRVLQDLGYSRLVLQIGRGTVVPDLVSTPAFTQEVYRYKNSLVKDIQEADLVISHAGAGSCLEVLEAGKPLLVVVNDKLMNNHQLELARQLHTDGHLFYCTCRTLIQTLQSMDLSTLKPFPPGQPEKFAAFLDKINSEDSLGSLLAKLAVSLADPEEVGIWEEVGEVIGHLLRFLLCQPDQGLRGFPGQAHSLSGHFRGWRHHTDFLRSVCGVCRAQERGGKTTLPFSKEAVAEQIKEIMLDSFFEVEPKFILATRAVEELRRVFGSLSAPQGLGHEDPDGQGSLGMAGRGQGDCVPLCVLNPGASLHQALQQQGEGGLRRMLLALLKEDPSEGHWLTLLDVTREDSLGSLVAKQAVSLANPEAREVSGQPLKIVLCQQGLREEKRHTIQWEEDPERPWRESYLHLTSAAEGRRHHAQFLREVIGACRAQGRSRTLPFPKEVAVQQIKGRRHHSGFLMEVIGACRAQGRSRTLPFPKEAAVQQIKALQQQGEGGLCWMLLALLKEDPSEGHWFTLLDVTREDSLGSLVAKQAVSLANPEAGIREKAREVSGQPLKIVLCQQGLREKRCTLTWEEDSERPWREGYLHLTSAAEVEDLR
ncbi:UNVERIFIED_CONTAM: hypothetical protein K2H54_048105 [Gekko kuhli]